MRTELITQIMEHIDAACPDYADPQEWHAGLESSMREYDVSLLSEILKEWEEKEEE